METPYATGPKVGSVTVGDGSMIGEDFALMTRKVYTRGRGDTIGYEWWRSGANQSFYLGRVDAQIGTAGEGPGGRGA